MKSYPSIDTKFVFDRHLIVFDKLDGSNIRAEWSRKQGFYKFGTRTRLLDESDPMLGGAKQLILETYGNGLAQCFKDCRYERAIAFFEYWGNNSFAGRHDPDDDHVVTLIDVAPYKKGILPAHEFEDVYVEFGIPNVVYRGHLTSQLIDEVKAGTLVGMTFEGVVCKFLAGGNKGVGMFKIKSRAWLAKLQDYCGDNDALFRRLV